MKGTMSNKLRKALCALFAGALVITSVPTANVVAFADETAETTSVAVKELSYNASDLELEENGSLGYAVNSENGYSIAFEQQYAQVNYKIPADVDVSKLVSIKVEAEATNLCIKLLAATDATKQLAVAYSTNEATQETLNEGKINDTDAGFIGLMSSAEGAVTMAIGKITFTVEGQAEPAEETKPEVTDPAEEQKPEVTEPAEETKPETTTPTEEKKPVTTKVTGKAITVTEGKTATIKMPIKKSKIKSVKYSKLSAKAAKVVKIDKKNNKVKGLKAGKATIKATVTKKNGDKVVMTVKVTVKAAPKPTTPTTPAQEKKTEYTYDLSQLKVIMAWDATVSGNTITFSDQYKQVFFEIPAEVDMSRFISVTFDTDPSDICVKMGKKFAEGEYSDTVHNHANSNSNSFVWDSPDLDKSTGYTSGGKIEKKEVTWVDLMSTAKTVKTIKKVTFKLAP